MHPGQTAADRYITSFEGTNYIGQLERVHTLLLALWEEYFGTVRDHPLSEYETDLIDHQLYFLSDALFNIILDMALDYGDSGFRGVGPFLEKAKEAEKAIECNKLVEKARKRQNAARTDWERTEYKARVDALAALPDDDAIPALKALLEGGDKA